MAGRDLTAFTRFIAEYQDGVAGLAYRLLGWCEDIEDVVQEVFMTAIRSLLRFRGECQFGT